MGFLFVSAQLAGHLDWGGFLPTAVCLQERGHSVLWASGAEVQETVARHNIQLHTLAETGWRWPPPPPLQPDPSASRAAVAHAMQRRSLDQWFDVERVTRAIQALEPLLTRAAPDVVVAEMFMAAAAIACARADIPLAVAGWPAPVAAAEADAHPMAQESRARLERLLQQANAPETNWTRHGPAALCSPHLHISYWSPRWHGIPPHGESRHGPQTRYVGGQPIHAATVPPPDTLPAPEDAPWALITLGTSFNKDPAFFANAAQAADALGCLPLIVSGQPFSRAERAWLQSRLPQTAVVLRHIDFATFLPHVRVAIHHGGAGTTHALVRHAIPQIVVPHAADQHRQAQGVARTEVGFHIAPRQAGVDNLTRALAALLPDRASYRTEARTLQAEFAALGGIERAADLLEAVASGHDI